MTPIWAPYGTAFTFRAPVIKTASTNFAVQADWGVSGIGPQPGDVKVIKDGASIANVTTLPAIYSTSYTWAFALSATEMAADEIIVQVVNRTYLTDQMFRIITLPDGALRSRLAQASTTANIVLDTSAVATDAWYVGTVVALIAGTGAGQQRVITAYTGSTKTATVDTAWVTAPDATTCYALFPQGITGLTAAQITAAVPTVAQISSQIFDTEIIETGVTFRNWHKAVGAMNAGIRTGVGTVTETYRAINNSGTTRVTYGFPSTTSGNPSSITYNFA
jgi:hypothetical protein